MLTTCAAASVAGGIATAKTGHARWIACGLTATIGLVWVLQALLNLQQSALELTSGLRPAARASRRRARSA